MSKELEIFMEEGQLVIDSREVAEKVGKNHAHLLRDIEGYIKILRESNFGLSDFFIESEYYAGNRNYKCYLLTKKGCDMVANKLTGKKGVLFTATYVTAFEKAQEENKRLVEDNTDLHTIAVSNDKQDERQYQADKVRYGWKNIRTILENCDYKTIEDEVTKIIDFHTNDLKKRDRANYNSHMEANNTDYKQLVRDRIFNILDDITNSTQDGVLRAVTSELRVDVIKDKLSTTNRSTSRRISNQEKELETVRPPSLKDYCKAPHCFSQNSLILFIFLRHLR